MSGSNRRGGDPRRKDARKTAAAVAVAEERGNAVQYERKKENEKENSRAGRP